MDAETKAMIAGMGVELTELAVKGIVGKVDSKIKSIKLEKDIVKIQNSYEEIINELLSDRENAIRIAQLYKNEYEDERYIYKGLNPDNYITFNNESWRILSIEKDGTLKIAKKDNIGRRTFDSRGYRDNTSNGTGGTYCIQGSSGCNAWTVSDNFVNVSKIGTVLKDSELNTYLNNEYLRTINEDSKYIINHDFNIGAPGDSSNTDDIATDISQEALYKWNGKIGLINVTDILRTTISTDCTSLSVAYNNGSKSVCSNNNWMWPQSGWLWTITPLLNITTNIRIVGGNGYISSTYSVDGGISVLPVLYLTSDIILSGEGTIDDPYTINS